MNKYDKVYIQDRNVEKETAHIDPVQSNDQVDENCTLSRQNSDFLQGHRCQAYLSDRSYCGKACIKNINVQSIADKSEDLKLFLTAVGSRVLGLAAVKYVFPRDFPYAKEINLKNGEGLV